MDWKDVAGAVGKAAPILGTLLGGPAGGAIGALVSAALGTENTPDAVSAAIAADPDAALKLAQFQVENETKLRAMVFAHAEFMQNDATRRVELDAGDRKSARDTSVSGGTAGRLFVMSCILLAITLGTEVAVMFLGLPPGVNDLVVGRVLGMLDSVALAIIYFHYGSSSGSHRKTELEAVVK